MKIRRPHLVVAAIILLAVTFLAIGVLYQNPPAKYYAHSLRNFQEADSVAGYPILINGSAEGSDAEFLTTEFQPNLSTMSPMELFRLPTAHGFQRFPENEARAVATGLVLYTGNPQGYPGQAILLGHRLPDGSIVQTFYSGLTKTAVKVGQHIPRGASLGKGTISLEIRKGVGIDIKKEEIADLTLNSPIGPQPKNRLDVDAFFKAHPLTAPFPAPLSLIQENEVEAARKELGLE